MGESDIDRRSALRLIGGGAVLGATSLGSILVSPLEILLGSSTASAAESVKGTELKPGDKNYELVHGIAENYRQYILGGYKGERPPVLDIKDKDAHSLMEMLSCPGIKHSRSQATWYDELNRYLPVAEARVTDIRYWDNPAEFIKFRHGNVDQLQQTLTYLGNPDSIALVGINRTLKKQFSEQQTNTGTEYLIVAIKGNEARLIPYTVVNCK